MSEHHLKNATAIFVTNLPVNTKRKPLLNQFKRFGKVLAIRFRTNTGKNYYNKEQLKNVPFLIAFIYYEKRESAEKSLVMNNEKFKENVIRVDLDVDISERIVAKNTVVIGNLKYGK